MATQSDKQTRNQQAAESNKKNKIDLCKAAQRTQIQHKPDAEEIDSQVDFRS